MFAHRWWSMRSLGTYIFIDLMWQHSLLFFGFDLIVAGFLVMIEDRCHEFRARNQ